MDKYKLELCFEGNVTVADPAVIFPYEFAVMTNVYLLFEQVLFSTDVVMADNIYVINVKKSIILDFIIIKNCLLFIFEKK